MGRWARIAVVPFGLVAALALLPETSAGGELPFEQRVRAQEALARVSYSHQIGASRSFEQAVPRAIVESRVRTALQQSLALELWWRTPVTVEMLRAETARIASSTRMPYRLREYYAALGNDPVLVAECLARPILVDRLARSFYAWDRRLHEEERRAAEELVEDLSAGRIAPGSEHPARSVSRYVVLDSEAGVVGRFRRERPDSDLTLTSEEFRSLLGRLPAQVGQIGPLEEDTERFVVRMVLAKEEGQLTVATWSVPKRSWDDWWRSVAPALDAGNVRTVASANDVLPEPRGTDATDSCLPDDSWDNGSLAVPEPRLRHTAVWTGSVMIVWGGTGAATFDSGGRYDPATGTWTAISQVNAPSPRENHTAVWTGTEMIVWGGSSGAGAFNTGGRYNPVTNTWSATATSGAPSARSNHTAVWTGSEMVVWGGNSGAVFTNTGGRYNPATNTWSTTATTGGPNARANHTAVWTGSLMIVWGGMNVNPLNTGARYNPATNSWSILNPIGAPAGRKDHTAVWTGSLMIVWGGSGSGPAGGALKSGGRYDPAANSWQPTSGSAPEPRWNHTAIWTGSRMVVWGGTTENQGNSVVNTGGQYDPASDSWWPTLSESAPLGRTDHVAVWTGTAMIVWGGGRVSAARMDGGRYDPALDAWTPTGANGAPSGRSRHSGVWTGSLLIIWGGGTDLGRSQTGGVYDPAVDAWTATTLLGAPGPRSDHTAVWTGTEMIVWGGYDGFTPAPVTGGRYDPIADSWTATTLTGVPTGRWFHGAVWTGTVMIVWGGDPGDGSRYDPATDVWLPMTNVGAPGRRSSFSAVWTGSRMIVFGGTEDTAAFGTGGLYDPVGDTWQPTSTVSTPTRRYAHTAVWTGSQMIVWGGVWDTQLGDGKRYDPVTDTWSPASMAGAPSARSYHSAVWTGHEMVVWGGATDSGDTNTGGRYLPGSDTWASTSVTEAASGRKEHTGLWTGSGMLVWGGFNFASTFVSGGWYLLGQTVDDDGDGFTECGGDCNDGNTTIHPGTVEICNRTDDDCNGAADDLAPPPAMPSLRLDAQGGNIVLIHWEAAPGATSYDLVRGRLLALRSSAGDFSSATELCIENDFSYLSRLEGSFLVPGDGDWYLVRGIGCGIPGTWDTPGGSQVDSRDDELAESPNGCP